MSCENCRHQVVITNCDDVEIKVDAMVGIAKISAVEGHPYLVERLRMWLRTEREVVPGSTVTFDGVTRTVAIASQTAGCSLTIDSVRTLAGMCTDSMLDVLEVTEADDCDKEPDESYPEQHEVIFQETDEQLTNRNDGRQWESVARVYFVNGLPIITSTTLFRLDDVTWKPLSAHDVDVIGRMPYVKVQRNPWPYAR